MPDPGGATPPPR